MGKYLTAISQTPDLILCSSSKRTVDTAEISMLEGNWEAKLEANRQLYLASVEEALELIKKPLKVLKS